MNICIQIGNSDNKLTQERWSHFIRDVETVVKYWVDEIYFSGFSRPDAEWQNACWIFSASNWGFYLLKNQLISIREEYNQDSIAWSVLETEFI